MTLDERIEFLMQSLESHDRQIGELTGQIGELAGQVGELAGQVGELTKSMNKLVA
jgi:ABC-type transporter Mla subunit MlaD